MHEPYSLSSDHHAHDWSQFATVNADGVNSRLQVILDELVRQAEETRKRGWKRMRLAGDLFHVRGKITPSVLNPTIATFKRICEMGIEIDAIAGNHDLEHLHSSALGNAMQSLDEIPGFNAIVEPSFTKDGVFMVPWVQDLDALRKEMLSEQSLALDLIIHAPVNGVIKGIPDHGLEVDELKKLDYRLVFAGHYHNFIDFGDGVYSIGATTHQTWGDPGTAAGFLMIDENGKVEHRPTKAPLFVNVDKPATEECPTWPAVQGNYVRLRLQDEEEAVIKMTRAACENNHALGIVDHSSKKRPSIRAESSAAPGATLQVSVATFVRDMETPLDKARIARAALSVLNDTMSSGVGS